MSRDLLILTSYVEAALLVVILSIGLNQVRKRLIIISNGLGDLGGMLATVESQHLRRAEQVGRWTSTPRSR